MSALSFKDICVKYVEWVSRNPQTTSEIESAVKWISYFLAGRLSESAVISELVYSISNLVVLFNDNIIRRAQPLHTYGSADRLKTWLTVLEYSEVFIEVSAGRTWGSSGRWIMIVLIQTFKTKLLNSLAPICYGRYSNAMVLNTVLMQCQMVMNPLNEVTVMSSLHWKPEKEQTKAVLFGKNY